MTRPHNYLHISLNTGDGHCVAFDLLEELLEQSLEIRMSVSGSSMLPTLGNNDKVTVRKVSPSDLSRGSMVLYRDSLRQLKLHRILRRYRDRAGVCWLQTCGDAMRCPDSPVRAEDILAMVCRIEKAGIGDNHQLIDLGLPKHRLRSRLHGSYLLLRAAIHIAIGKSSRKISRVFNS